MILAATLFISLQVEADADRRIRDMEARIMVASVLNALRADGPTLAKLRDAVERAQELRKRFEKKRRLIRERQLRAFADFHREDLENRGFTPRVEGEAGRWEHEEKVAQEAACKQVNRLEKGVAGFLTEDQLRVFERWGLAPGWTATRLRPKKPALPHELAPFIRDLRRLSPAQFEARKGDLRVRLEGILGFRASDAPDLAAYVAEADRALEEVRRLSAKDVPLRAPEILESVRPRSELQRIRARLTGFFKEKYGGVGPIGRFLLHPATLEILSRRTRSRPKTPTGSGK